VTTATDQAKLNAARSADHFGERLQWFTARWMPRRDPEATYQFQMDLTNLMVDAMRHKSDCMSLGITTYADLQFSEMALRPLAVIMEEPKK
jgi:hypothetical protein